MNIKYDRFYEASPVANITIDESIAAGASYILDVENDDSSYKKYLPFNFLVVTNTSSQPLKVHLDQSTRRSHIVAGNAEKVFDASVLGAWSSLRIENIGAGAVSAGEVIIQGQRQAQTADSMLSRIHRRLFSRSI